MTATYLTQLLLLVYVIWLIGNSKTGNEDMSSYLNCVDKRYAREILKDLERNNV